jgi:hypothetical protein
MSSFQKMATLIVLLMLLLPMLHCRNSMSKEKEGYELAKTYCQSCHRFPEPDLLNKKTWSAFILPKMGSFLGFRHFETGGYVEYGKEMMKLSQWNKIVDYYVSQSPEFPVKKKSQVKIQAGLKQFTAFIPAFTVKKPVTTMVGIDSLGKRIFFGDGFTAYLYRLSQDFLVQDSFKTGKGISNLHLNGKQMMVLTMGVLHPSDEKSGQLVSIEPDSKKSTVLLDHLQRPVHASYADLNNDGLEDIIVCEFGNSTGQLSWFENKGTGILIKHILRDLPGAVKTAIYDFNKDGRPDIIALMAQGDEGIFIYYNQGGGVFKEDRILKLPPSYGSNYFELADINKDGHPDILATNGDNGDYPPILKAYHGLRIYINDGSNRFTEKTFLPVNGAGKAIARDFDGDGDLDIASIAYFPDYEHTPEEGFIYWENKDGSFEPSTFPQVTAGRWLTMDSADIDGDGDIDIVLGNTFFPLGYISESLKKKWERYTPSILVLKNNMKK